MRSSVRKYRTLELDDDDDDDGGDKVNDVSPADADSATFRNEAPRLQRTMSDAFTRVDVDLMDDMQAAMQRIVNTVRGRALRDISDR